MYLEASTRMSNGLKWYPVFLLPAYFWGLFYFCGTLGLYDGPATRLVLALTGLKAIHMEPCTLRWDRFGFEPDISALTALPRMSGRYQSNLVFRTAGFYSRVPTPT